MATSGQVNGIAIGVIGLGGILAWSALNNKKVITTAGDLIKGSKPTPGPQQSPIATTTYSTAPIQEVTPQTGTAAANEAIAKKLAVPYGWSSGDQWDCLVQLWTRESGWSNTAENPSGAYGIAQALPNTKYPLAGQPPSEGGSASASVQILWGLTYILGRYGSPCSAWNHETSQGWY